MKRRDVLRIGLAGAALLQSPRVLPQKVPRVGALLFSTPQSEQNFGALRQGLLDLGYVEGRTLAFVYRFAEGKPERLRDLANELVGEKPDVIVAMGGDVAPFARAATNAIPVVMFVSVDPVEAGLVANLSRPGGNVTGTTLVSSALAAKRVQLLKQMMPGVRHVGVLWNPDHVDPEYRETRRAGEALGVTVHSMEVRGPAEFDAAFRAAVDSGVQALMPISSRLMTANRVRILHFAAERRIPVAAGWGPWAAEGALFSYGPDQDLIARRTALYVDKILKGAKPAVLAVEQPTRFDLIINQRSAKAFGVHVPEALLLMADRVIE